MICVNFIYKLFKFFCTLAFPSSMFLSCVVYLSFTMITYSVGAIVVAGLEAPMEDGDESSVSLVECIEEL